MTTTLDDLGALTAGGLIVSCQAYPGEPMRTPDTMSRVASAVVKEGAVAMRLQGLEDLRTVVGAVDVPAIDATLCTRADGSSVADRVLEAAVCAVCAGTAITHPTSLTRWFVEETR
ncbi:hypothetical protein FNH13_04925 [Ornithinimicrobium ciconiae]|uniref:N-acylglucosamine-6-phosphate 2-epimerase n=1 Tax=Ornithinimicrobium ciconiae TaxID=2594265 RepID=A0A516G8B4_9MICO|nr:hypothetical protein [Ornithinimicrobium ciconiae]QDO87768.1 hypothetical protein FNH13_04925 [Ornithinimicrobium ciconiae]